MSREGLATGQRTFLAALALPPRNPPLPRTLFREPPVGTIEERFSIYATGLIPRVVEALEDDYPAIRRILGQGPFTSLAARYVARHPPGSFDLGRVGGRLPDFLGQDPLRDALPFLPDLAALEWALSRAFIAADAQPVTWEELQTLGDEGVATTPLRLIPGTRVFRSSWPLVRLWRLREVPDEQVDLRVESKPGVVLVRRRLHAVTPIDVDEPSARLVEQAERQGNLADLLERAAAADEIDSFVSAFRGLVVDGVFSKEMVSGGLAPDSGQ